MCWRGSLIPFKQLVRLYAGTLHADAHARYVSIEEMPMKVQFALLLMASSSFGYSESQKTWDGFVTDTHCGTHCQRTSAMTPDRACVRLCVKQGSKYGLWSGDHVYTLEPQAKASKFAAETVRVTGDLSNDTIQIKSIARIKKQIPQQ